MISRRKKTKDVLMRDLARGLPVNKWFNIDEFCALTGMLKLSAKARVTLLCAKWFIERGEFKHAGKCRITTKMMAKMVKTGARNKAKIGKAVKSNAKIIEDAKVKELEKLCFSTVW